MIEVIGDSTSDSPLLFPNDAFYQPHLVNRRLSHLQSHRLCDPCPARDASPHRSIYCDWPAEKLGWYQCRSLSVLNFADSPA